MSRKVYLILFLLPSITAAQLQLGKIFTDHMVFQRDRPIYVYGKGLPDYSLSVEWQNECSMVVVGRDSNWVAELSPRPASNRPRQLRISMGGLSRVLNNVLVGDVWLCIGQSNMEWPMQKEHFFRDEIREAGLPSLRFFNPVYAGKNIFGTPFTDTVLQQLTPELFFKGAWQVSDSSSFRTMSAVGYYFGKKLNQSMDLPIGLINLSVGGAPLETFIDPAAMESRPSFAAKVNGDWMVNDALPVWVRERGRQNLGQSVLAPADQMGKNHPFKPGFVYHSGIEPLLSFPIKGIICYQGESNAQEPDRVMEYDSLTTMMVEDYRKKWKEDQLPYYYVQLSSIDTVRYKGQLWPEFRDAQRRLMEHLPYSGMAVCSDAGDSNNVHPSNKKVVGDRLARWALARDYHQKIIPSGPLPYEARYSPRRKTVILKFHHARGGLRTSDQKGLRGFSIDGKNDIASRIAGKKVFIRIPFKPEHVYYGWKPFTDANLINKEALPASTFKFTVR